MSGVNGSGGSQMGRRFMLLASMALLALTLATGATATQSASAPVVSFSDQTGDSGTAADIATVSVTNDDQGQYGFDIALATPYTTTGGLSLYLDTDMNPTTGDRVRDRYTYSPPVRG